MDAVAMRVARLPPWVWKWLAMANWPTRWRADTVKAGQVWMLDACGATMARRSIVSWRKAMAKALARLPGRKETAAEWGARTGHYVPDWLR